MFLEKTQINADFLFDEQTYTRGYSAFVAVQFSSQPGFSLITERGVSSYTPFLGWEQTGPSSAHLRESCTGMFGK